MLHHPEEEEELQKEGEMPFLKKYYSG